MSIQRSNDPAAFLAFERDAWNTVIGDYERLFASLTRQTAEPLFNAAKVTKGQRLLDVCSGHGGLAAEAARRGADVVAIDFSAEAVAIARARTAGVDFRQGDAQNLEFPGASFDTVVCGYGIIHVPEPDRALSEMFRVLKPSGRLAVSVWDKPSPDNGFGVVFEALKKHGRLDVPLPHGPDFFQFSDPEAMTGALGQIGLTDVTAIVVRQFWEMRQPADLIEAFLRGGVRLRALLREQEPSALAAIKVTVAKGMERFRAGDGYRVPMPAIVGSGRKP